MKSGGVDKHGARAALGYSRRMKRKRIWERPIVVLALGVLFILAGGWDLASGMDRLDGAFMLVGGLVFIVGGALFLFRRLKA